MDAGPQSNPMKPRMLSYVIPQGVPTKLAIVGKSVRYKYRDCLLAVVLELGVVALVALVEK